MATNFKPTTLNNPKYIASWGDDTLGDGTEEKPLKTPVLNALNVISGVYHGIIMSISVYSQWIIEAQSAIFIGNNEDNFLDTTSGSNTILKNLVIKNYKYLLNGNPIGNLRSLIVDNCIVNLNVKIRSNDYNSNTIFINSLIILPIDGIITHNNDLSPYAISLYPEKTTKKSTFSGGISEFNVNLQVKGKNNIFYNHKINIPLNRALCIFFFKYSLFDESCTYKFGSEATYTAAAGATENDKLTDLRNRCVTEFGGVASDYFIGCRIGDPEFNDPENEDYTLKPTSIARNMADDGRHVGKYGVALRWNFRANQADGDWLNSEAVNAIIADNSLKIDDDNETTTITGLPKAYEKIKELASLPVFGFTADRNGEQIGYEDIDLATEIQPGTGVLTIGEFYQVFDDMVTHNSNNFLAGQVFKAVNADFTSAGSGTVRQITATPFRPSVQWRFSYGYADTIDENGTLTEGNWYVVKVGDDITYNSNTLTEGTIFRCETGVTSFSGAGTVETIFTTTDDYHWYAANEKPMANKAGNVPAGAITKGNGHADFDFDNALPVQAKFLQPKITIQANNLAVL